jgi:hypothetical protein
LIVGAHGQALVPLVVGDQGGKKDNGNLLEHGIFLDRLAKGVAVHLGHLDIGDDNIYCFGG